MYSRLFLIAFAIFSVFYQSNEEVASQANTSQDLISREVPINEKHQTSHQLMNISTNVFQKRLLESKSNYKIEMLEALNRHLMNNTFMGSWSGSKPDNFRNKKGLAYLHYYPDKIEDSLFSFELYIYDNSYIAQDLIIISFMEDISYIQDDFYETNSTLNLKNNIVMMSSGNAASISTLKECRMDIMMTFLNHTNNDSFVSDYKDDALLKDLAVQFDIQSSNCSLRISTSILIKDDLSNTASLSSYLLYSVFMVVSAVTQCISCVMLINDFERRNSRAKRVSVGTLRLLNTFDFYICVSNLDKFAFNSNAVGIVTIPYAILSLHYEFKLIYIVHTIQEKLSAQERKVVGTINSITIILSFVAIFVTILFGRAEYIYFALGLSQLPQILQNYFTQLRHRWNCCIMLPLTLPKILYAFYVLAYDRNVLRILPNPNLLKITCILILVQCIFLLIQTRRSRFCQKDRVDYTFCNITDIKEEIKHEVCSICLDKLAEASVSVSHVEEINEEANKKALLDGSTLDNISRGVLITTSCNHTFHDSCLRDWLELKYECPYCRNNIPPLPDNEY